MAATKHTYDYYGRKEPAVIFLAKPGKRLCYAVNGIDNSTVSLTLSTNNTTELSFSVDKYIDGEPSNGYDLIDEQMELYCDGIWFKITTPPTINYDGLRETKEVTAESYEIMLTQYKLIEFAINTGGEESYEMQYQKEHEQDKFYQVKFYNPHEPKLSLLDLVLSHVDIPGWKIGYVDDKTPSEDGILLSDEICNFEVDEKDVYAFLTQDVAQAYKCIFEFDTQKMLINVYRIESLGKDTNITIGFRNIQNSVTITRDDNLVTQFYVDGLDGYDIASSNLGTNLIDDLSHFIREPYMPHALQIKYKAWLAYRESLRPEYIKLSKEYNRALDIMEELDKRVPVDTAKNDWFSSSVEDLKSAYNDNAAIIKGLESTYVDDKGNFDLVALKKSPDWPLYESIMNYTLPAIVAALQAKNEPVEGFGKGNIISNVNPVALGEDWLTEGKNIATFSTVQIDDSPAYGITRGVNVKFNNASAKAGILHKDITVESGQEYVLSCYVKGIGSFYLVYGTPGESRQATEFHIDSGWTRVYISYRANSKMTNVAFTGTSDYTVCGMQLEMGTSPSQFGYFTQSEDILKAFETDWKLYGISELKAKLGLYEGCIDELKKNGYADPYDPLSKYEESYHSQMHQIYLDYLQLKEQCEAALKERQAEYDAAKPEAIQDRRQKIAAAVLLESFGRNVDGTDLLQLDQNGVLCFKDNINVSVDEKGVLSINDTFVNVEAIDGILTLSYTDTPFTEDELLIIKSLYNQATYTNENIIVTNLDDTVDAVDKQKRLYDDAVEQLYVESHPQYTYTNTINNILALPEFKEFHDELEVNNFIRLGITDTDYVKLRVIEIDYNPCDLDEQMEITFSNMVQYKSKRNDFNTLLDESINRASRNGGRVESVNKSDTTDYVITADVIKNIFSNPLFQSMLNGSTVGGAGSGGTINADMIVTELIKADEGIFKKLTADTAFIKYLDVKLVSADKIVTKIIEADEATIKKLSATIITASEINADVANIKNLIAGNAGVGNLQTINLTAKNVTIDEAVIKELIAAKISVADLMAHSATAELITLISSDGRPTIAFANSTQQFYDSSGNVRVQIGQDGNGDFNFVVRGTDGTTALFDSHGIRKEGIPDNTIITKMISDKQITPNKASWNVEVDDNGNQITSIENIYMGNGEKFGVKYNEIIENIEGTKTTVSEIKSIVDEQAKVIENKVSKTEIDTYIEGNAKVTGMRDQIAQQTIDINGITTTVSDVQTKLSDAEKTISGHTTQINQTATTLSLIATGNTESSLTITDKFISLVSDGVIGIAAKEFNIDALTKFMNNSKDGSSTVINGGAIITNTITADKLVADILTSKNYKGPLTNDRFAQTGTKYLLSDGTITSMNFVIDTEGNVYIRGNGEFTGKIIASQGNIAGFGIKANYIAKGTEAIHGANNSVYVGTDGISCGTSFWVDANGNMNASNGTFGGTLSGATGTFSGNLSAAGGTFKGRLEAATGTFSGEIVATSLTLGSGVSISSGNISGLSDVATSGNYNDLYGKPDIPSDLTLYIQKDNTIGTVDNGTTGFRVSRDGLLQASNAVIYGTIYASSGFFSGDVVATTMKAQKVYSIYNTSTSAYQNIIYYNDSDLVIGLMGTTYVTPSSALQFGYNSISVYGDLFFNYGSSIDIGEGTIAVRNLQVIGENGSIPHRNIKWNNNTKFDYSGYGHTHTIIADSYHNKAVAIGDAAESGSPIADWAFMPYNITSFSDSTNEITGLSRDKNASISIGSENNQFKNGYFKSITLGGVSRSSWPSGEGGSVDLSNYVTTTTFNSHKNSKSNPHGVTYSQIGAAEAGHTHDTYAVKGHGHKMQIDGVTRSAMADFSSYNLCTVANATAIAQTNAGSGGGSSIPNIVVASDGVQRPPITTGSGSTQKVAYFTANNTSSLNVKAQFGSSGYSTMYVTLSSSDKRLKNNVQDTKVNGLSIINSIRMRQFDWIRDGKHQEIGVIADELELIDKNLAFGGGYDEEGDMDIKSVDSFYLQGYEIKAIQELSKINEQQSKEISELKNILLQLQGEISILKQKMEGTAIC